VAGPGLVRAHNHSLTPQEVIAQIVGTGDVVVYDKPIGPRLNAYRALTQNVTSVEPSPTPGGVSLGEAWPNPFTTNATIGFSISQAGPARLSIYDVRGRMVHSSRARARRIRPCGMAGRFDGRMLGSGSGRGVERAGARQPADRAGSVAQRPARAMGAGRSRRSTHGSRLEINSPSM
jgi:hypothetical protein